MNNKLRSIIFLYFRILFTSFSDKNLRRSNVGFKLNKLCLFIGLFVICCRLYAVSYHIEKHKNSDIDIPNLITQEFSSSLLDKLITSNGEAYNHIGSSLAKYGNRIVVGSFYEDVDNKNAQGAAYIFTKADGIWKQTAKLTADDGKQGDIFGTSVAIFKNTVAVGAIYANINGNKGQGAVYIFTKADGTWKQTAKLTAYGGMQDDSFGTSVSIDNNTVVVGTKNKEINKNKNQGAVYVFENINKKWQQKSILTAMKGEEGNYFGASVSISGDKIAVGAPFNWIDETSNGAVYIFKKKARSWEQSSLLTSPGRSELEDFGTAVSIHHNIITVGAGYPQNNGLFEQKSMYIFKEN